MLNISGKTDTRAPDRWDSLGNASATSRFAACCSSSEGILAAETTIFTGSTPSPCQREIGAPA